MEKELEELMEDEIDEEKIDELTTVPSGVTYNLNDIRDYKEVQNRMQRKMEKCKKSSQNRPALRQEAIAGDHPLWRIRAIGGNWLFGRAPERRIAENRL